MATHVKHDCGSLGRWSADRCCVHCHERFEFHSVREVSTEKLLRLCCTAVSFVFDNTDYRFDVDKDELERALTQASVL